LRKNRRPGLRRLFSNLRVNSNNLNEDDITFLVTPRINAASRMGRPHDAFNLLCAETEEEADSYAKHLDEINNERKGVVAGIVKEAKKRIKEKIDSEADMPIIVLGNPDWKPSLLGLAANSIAEEFNRPVFLWGRDEKGVIKGSCRSDGVTDLVELMQKVNNSFLEFGGHKQSGGFSLLQENIHELEKKLIDASTNIVNQNPENFMDAEMSLSDVNEELVSSILRLAPFGAGNEKPIFLLRDVLPERISRFGKAKEHLSIDFRNGSSNTIRAISFFCAPDQFGDALKEGIATNMVANLEKSFFNGSSEIRFRIIDFFK